MGLLSSDTRPLSQDGTDHSSVARWLLIPTLSLRRSRRQFFLDGLAREHLIAHRRVIDEVGNNHSDLPQILELHTIVNIHIRVMRARLVLDRVLDELESWNAYCIEREVIRSASVAHCERVHSQIFELLHPRLENGLHCRVALHVDAANLACAIVDVEISGDLGLLRLDRHRAGFASAQTRGSLRAWSVERRTRSEVMDHIPSGAEQTFLFAAPQTYTDSAARL